MHVIAIPAFNPGARTGTGNVTYLIPGTEPLLVDAGVGHERHLDELARALDGVPLARVLVTHNHSDHAAGVPSIAERWPGATFLKKPWPARDGRSAVPWTSVGDGDRIPAGGACLDVVATPGHAPDHVCLFEPAERMLFGGDLLVSGNTVVIPASHGGNLREYLASLARVRRLKPARVLPAHGPVIDDVDTVIDAYLEHRRQRERQILAALGAGASTPATIVTRVYDALPQELTEFARESVLAHLVKLLEDGRVIRSGDEWTVC